MDALRDAVLERFGQIDVLVNNAAIDDKFATGAAEESRFENYGVERFRRQLDVNVTGVFLCCQRLGAVMADRGRGSIVNVASTYGLVAPNQDLYLLESGAHRVTEATQAHGQLFRSLRAERESFLPSVTGPVVNIGVAARARTSPRS